MADQLYPVFEIPSMEDKEDTEGVYAEEYFWPGPLFDFTTGDFTRNGANQVVMVEGYDEYMLWVMKCIRTQIGSCAAYPDFGIDLNGAIAEVSHEAVSSALEKTITEGLLANPRTDRVRDFKLTFNGDELTVYFIVEPKGLPAFDMTMTIVQ